MAKYAIIDNGVVTNLIVLDDPSTYPIPVTLVLDDTIQIGATYSDGIFTNPTVTSTEPTSNTIPKSIVMARLISANMMTQAYQGLTANPIYFARWFAPDRPDVDCNDPDAISFVHALGLDPTIILAPVS